MQKFNTNEVAQSGSRPVRQRRSTADSIKLYIFYIFICEAKRQILFFFNKTMHKFKIGYNFEKPVFNEKPSKMIIFLKISIFTFNDTGLDTQKFDQKMNYNYKSRFKF